MKFDLSVIAFGLFSLFALNLSAQENVQCSENNLKCFNEILDNAKSIDIDKTEREGSVIIESTHIKIINADNSPYTEFPDMQSMPGFKISSREKKLEAVAHISVNRLKAIKKTPKNSIFTNLLSSCQNLRLPENIKKLEGTDAQCILNEGVSVTYVPEDIYWCDNHSNCMHGTFPHKRDERYRLVSDGISSVYKCTGTLIERLQSICAINKWGPSDFDSGLALPYYPETKQ